MRQPLKGQRVLVTGGAGFIGSHLVDRLIAEGAREVVVIDNFFLGDEDHLKSALKAGATLYRDDAEFAGSLGFIFERHAIDTVFNCATKALNYSFINPANAFDTNTRVILNLLEFQRRQAFKTLAHFSSSEVYGTALIEPMDEDHPLNPTTTYAAGKAAADLALTSYVRMYELDAYILRPFNNFGPRQNYQGELAGVIPSTIRRILRREKPVIQGDGTQSRNFIFVNDTVDAVMALHEKIPRGESVNISAGDPLEIRQVVMAICRGMNYAGTPEYLPRRTADVDRHRAGTKRLNSLTVLRPTPFENALSQTIAWQIEATTKK